MSLQQLKLALDVTPEEIIREQPAIEEWKKEKGLPTEYGKIDEIGDYYVLSKRIDLPKFISLPFRECDFVLSVNPKTQKIHIHSIHYPKNKYDREYVEAMAYRTTNCPYCLDGTKFVPLESFAKFLKPYIPIETNGTQTGGNKKMVLEKWAIVSDADPENSVLIQLSPLPVLVALLDSESTKSEIVAVDS